MYSWIVRLDALVTVHMLRTAGKVSGQLQQRQTQLACMTTSVPVNCIGIDVYHQDTLQVCSFAEWWRC